MAYVKTVKTTRAIFASLLQNSTVDPDTLYFVNEGNGWDEQSLDTEGDIYLGAKLLTQKPTNPMDNPSGVFFVTAGSQGNTADAWLAALAGLTGYYDGLKVVVCNSTGAASGTSLSLNLNSLGARSVYRYGTTAISAIPNGSCTLLTYVGTPASGKWVMDSYVNSTYTLANVAFTFGGSVADVYGVKRYSLCAVTSGGKMSSFTTTHGTGAKSPVDLDFKIGQPLFYRDSDTEVSAGTTFSTASFFVSYSNFNMRYTGTNTLLTSSIGKGHDIYLEVSVDPQAGTYRPTVRLLVTDAQLVQGKFYIHVGRQQSNTASYWYRCNLLASNPLYYYDGTNLVPYDIWRANVLSADIASLAKPLAVQETADWVQYDQTNQRGWIEAAGIYFDIGNVTGAEFNLGNFQADDRFEISVELTVANIDVSSSQILFSVDLMVKKEGVIDVVEHLASTMVSIPAAAEKPQYASASLNILRQLKTGDVNNQLFLRIEAKEVSTQSGKTVRFYNCVQDFLGIEHQHASSYKIKVWRCKVLSSLK